MSYHTKYDENNRGTVYVFDHFYRIILNKGVISNFVACPGKDVDRYIDYASMVCRASRAKAYFFENSDDHLNIIKQKLAKSTNKTAKRIKVIKGDAIIHESFGGPRVARVEDIGFGTGIRSMIYQGITRLFKQSRAVRSNKNVYKVQIMDSSLRGVSQKECCELFQQYLSVVGLKIKKFNDIDMAKNPNLFAEATYAKKVTSYKTKDHRNCNVYKHVVELFPNKYEDASLHMYSCINGSKMLQSMLIYK